MQEAAATAREALEQAESLDGKESRSLLPVLVALANALIDNSQARGYLDRAMRIAESSHPPDEHERAVIRSNLANRRAGAGDLLRAHSDALEGVAAAEQAYGSDHPRIVDVLISAAIAARDCDELSEAQELRAVTVSNRRPSAGAAWEAG